VEGSLPAVSPLGNLHAVAAGRPPLRGCRAAAVAALIAVAAGATGCARLPPAADSARLTNLPCRQMAPASARVVWWSAASDRDRDKLARWCETVGPVAFHTSSPIADRHRSDTLTVVSWNVHVGAGDVDALIDGLRAGEFTAGTRVRDFVLLLQEAYRRDDAIPVRLQSTYPVPSRIAVGRGRGPDISHLWQDDSLSLFYAPSMRNGFTDADREDRGNAIASTLPLRQPTLLELPLQHQRRVVPVATLEGQTAAGVAWTVRVADVHLDTALALMHGGPFAARRRQAEGLVAGLSATAPEDHPITIVAGDFNSVLGSNEPAIAYLRGLFPDGPALPDATTFSGPLGFHATLDHLFVGGRVKSVEVRRLPSRFGSDHYPLLATISF
jgi:endonuclease/exonuclease/phosphatase family metal-dependent hydrolase